MIIYSRAAALKIEGFGHELVCLFVCFKPPAAGVGCHLLNRIEANSSPVSPVVG
jgi:hypothetical protein